MKSEQELETKRTTNSATSDTRTTVTELPTKVSVDDETYSIRSALDTLSLPNEFDTVTIETPCMYCDTKLQLQYSGELPTLISCSCPKCGETIKIADQDKEYENSLSLDDLEEQLKLYHARRSAFLKGQKSEPVSKRKFVLKGVLLASLFPLSMLILGGTIVKLSIKFGLLASGLLGLFFLMMGVSLVGYIPDDLFAFVGTKLIGVSGRPDRSIVNAFFEGNEQNK